MTDDQVRAYLAAHPEIASAALGMPKPPAFAAGGDVEAAPAAADGASDWASAGSRGGAGAGKKAGGGGWGGFGFGGAAKAPAAPEYVPPAVPFTAAAPAAEPTLPGASSFAIGGADDENPFKR